MTRDEQNRKIAEWALGWRWWTRFDCRWFGPPNDWDDLGEDVRECTAEEKDEKFGMYEQKSDSVPAPDFFLDESANAMVLEKMPDGTRLQRAGKGWALLVDDLSFYRGDRKTVIADAALALIEKEQT